MENYIIVLLQKIIAHLPLLEILVGTQFLSGFFVGLNKAFNKIYGEGDLIKKVGWSFPVIGLWSV